MRGLGVLSGALRKSPRRVRPVPVGYAGDTYPPRGDPGSFGALLKGGYMLPAPVPADP